MTRHTQSFLEITRELARSHFLAHSWQSRVWYPTTLTSTQVSTPHAHSGVMPAHIDTIDEKKLWEALKLWNQNKSLLGCMNYIPKVPRLVRLPNTL